MIRFDPSPGREPKNTDGLEGVLRRAAKRSLLVCSAVPTPVILYKGGADKWSL